MSASTPRSAPSVEGEARLLVVEDDAVVRSDLGRSLESMGYRIAATARSGEEAVASARQDPPDLALMDIRLDGEMDGIETGEILLDELDVPVIYLTAYADDETRRRVRETTPYGYVVKPYDERDLQTAVEVALLRHRLESRLQRERARLAERVKEQSCLHDVSRILHDDDRPLARRLRDVVQRIPAGWQYPGVTAARLEVGAVEVATDDFRPAGKGLTSPIEDEGERLGEIAVHYLEERPEEDIGPFLVEEQRLLDGIAERVEVEVRRARTHRRADRLVDILQSTSDLVGTATAELETLWVNRPGRRMLGIPADEDLRGVSVEAYSTGEAFEKIRSEGLPAARREGVWEGETALLTRKGEEIPVSQVVIAHRSEGGEVAYFSTIARDISDRKEAERRIRESERRLRQMAEAIEEVFWLRDPASREMLYVSPAFEEIFGRPVEELYEEPRLWLRQVHPDDRDRVRRAAFGGEDFGFEEEFRIVRPDGEVRWIRDRGFPVETADGEVRRVAGVARDVTDERSARRASEEQRRTLARILETAAEGILLTDAEGDFEYANPAAGEILGLEEEVVAGRSYRDPDWNICAPDGGPFPSEQLPVARVLRTGEPVTGIEHGVERPDGSRVVLSVDAAPLIGADGELTGVVASIRDVTRQKEFEDQLQRRALHDYLTDLPNRALFRDRVEQALERVARSGDPVAVCFLDLRRFKVVNESLGHEAGDRVLQEVAGRLRRVVRGEDTVARAGGDEFTVLLEGVGDEEGVEEAARRLAGVFGEPIRVGDDEIPMDASIGIAVHRPGSDGEVGVSELVRRADAAMYRARERPGTGFELAGAGEEAAPSARLERETRLRRALEEDRIRTVYQPIYAAGSGEIRGVEALARWTDEELGRVSPGVFIPLAEETGLIVRLGELQLERACRQLLEEDFAGPDGDGPVRLHVNLSARQLEDPDMVRRVRDILGRTGFPPSRLCLEITESAAMRQPDVVDRLKEVGVELALDDFGTRYSTLSQLRRLKADALKIDRTFVDGMVDDDRDRAIVETILTLGRSLGLTVVAEGVEEPEQLDLLREMGCEEAQGFLLARPGGEDRLREEIGRARRGEPPA